MTTMSKEQILEAVGSKTMSLEDAMLALNALEAPSTESVMERMKRVGYSATYNASGGAYLRGIPMISKAGKPYVGGVNLPMVFVQALIADFEKIVVALECIHYKKSKGADIDEEVERRVAARLANLGHSGPMAEDADENAEVHEDL